MTGAPAYAFLEACRNTLCPIDLPLLSAIPTVWCVYYIICETYQTPLPYILSLPAFAQYRSIAARTWHRRARTSFSPLPQVPTHRLAYYHMVSRHRGLQYTDLEGKEERTAEQVPGAGAVWSVARECMSGRMGEYEQDWE